MIEIFFRKLLVIGGVALTLCSYVNADTVDFDFNSPEAATALNTRMASDNPTFTNMGMTDTVVLSVDALLPIQPDRTMQPTTLRVQGGPGLSVNSADNSSANFFDGSEAATLSFDTDVIVTEFDFFLLNTGEFAQVVIDGNPTPFRFTDAPDDIFVNPFGADTVIAAGTGITFSIASDSVAGTEFGLQGITVDTVSAVPEPSSLAIIGLGSLLMMTRRRR